MSIPDHDGPIPPERMRELRSRLVEIDRVYGGSPFRRAFRAALCRHYGYEMGEHREMRAMMAEAGDWHGMTEREVDRLTMPTAMYLARHAIRRSPKN